MNKILVIDNDYDNAEVIHLILESENFHVKSIHNSSLLAQAIVTFDPDLIVMDILLDDGDGRDFCNYIKQDKATQNIPVLLITAMLESQFATIPCNPDALMFKPFDYDDLSQRAKQLVKMPERI